MVIPLAVIGVELVLAAIGIGTTVAGVVETKKAVKVNMDETKKAAIKQLEIKVINDLMQVPTSIPS